MAHWDQDNPWREKLVYVPLEELADALADGRTIQLTDGSVVEYTPELMMEHWHQYSDQLDAYLIPGAEFGYSVGIRYGANDSDYLSLYAPDQTKLLYLFQQYSQQPPAIGR
jgi:hypothetical protein